MRAFAMALLLGLAGCASAPMGRNVEQEIRVETPGCPQVRCELRNDRGTWVVAQTPGTVVVTTSALPLEVGCRAPDNASGTARSVADQRPVSGTATATGAAVGGGLAAAAVAPAVALGGPFGFLAATVVLIGAVGGAGAARAADAAQREFSYPDVVQVAMQCTPLSVGAAALAGATWGLVVRGAVPGDSAPQAGVWVVSVLPGGHAQAAGVRAGDLLLAADGRPLAGTLGLEDELRGARGPLALLVRRGADLLTVSLPPRLAP